MTTQKHPPAQQPLELLVDPPAPSAAGSVQDGTTSATRSTTMSPVPPPSLDRFADRLIDAAARHGLPPLACLPTMGAAMVLLGDPDTLHRLTRRAVDDRDFPAAAAVAAILTGQATVFSYLAGLVPSLIDRLPHTPAGHAAARDTLTVLNNANLPHLIEQDTLAGDLFGWFYTRTIAPGDQKRRGAFYTPPSIAALMVQLNPLPDHAACHDPCAGAGGLLIAMIRHLRATGGHPETIHWIAGDIDRTALALAGIALSAHGMPHVTLTPGDALHPVTLFVGLDARLLVARLGMTYSPCRVHDPGGVVTGFWWRWLIADRDRVALKVGKVCS